MASSSSASKNSQKTRVLGIACGTGERKPWLVLHRRICLGKLGDDDIDLDEVAAGHAVDLGRVTPLGDGRVGEPIVMQRAAVDGDPRAVVRLPVAMVDGAGRDLRELAGRER